MAAGSSTLERVVGWLIPPASREEVLGDLRERCGENFLAEAVRVIPFIVISRIRRTADPVIVLMQALALFLCFTLAAAWLDRPLLDEPSGFARLEIPVAIALLVLSLADAYADPRRRPALRPLVAPVLGMMAAFATPVLPRAVMIWGGLAAMTTVAVIRMVFPPLADRPQAARIPAHWQKLEMDAVNLAALLLLPFAAIVFLLIAVSRWLRL